MPLPKIWNDYDRLDAADLNADFAYVLARSGDGGGAFPAGPTAGDRFYRTDYHAMYYYDGARWLSETLFGLMLTAPQNGLTANSNAYYGPVPSTSQVVWLVERITKFLVSGGTALSATHKWVGTLSRVDAANVLTTLDTDNIAAGAINVWRSVSAPLGLLLDPATSFVMRDDWAKTGTPGTLFANQLLTYRLVG